MTKKYLILAFLLISWTFFAQNKIPDNEVVGKWTMTMKVVKSNTKTDTLYETWATSVYEFSKDGTYIYNYKNDHDKSTGAGRWVLKKNKIHLFGNNIKFQFLDVDHPDKKCPADHYDLNVIKSKDTYFVTLEGLDDIFNETQTVYYKKI